MPEARSHVVIATLPKFRSPDLHPVLQNVYPFLLYSILILAPGVPSSGCNRVLWVFGIFLGHKVIRVSTLITVVGAPVSF
jgi:hypothetical protein